MNVEIYIFIPMPENEWLTDNQIYRERLYEMLDQLCSMNNKIKYSYDDKEVSLVKIRLLKERQRKMHKIVKDADFDISPFEILEFSTFFNEAEYNDIKFIDRGVILYLEKIINEIFIVANLCILGSINFRNSLVFFNNKCTDIKLERMDVWPLQRAFQLIDKIKWPENTNINFSIGWEWLQSHHYINVFIKNKTSRALNAFSRIFTFYQREKDEAIYLLWALIGIEALYVEGKASIMEQVRGKIFTLFGEQKSYKKLIGDMYNFRSRFVHGDIDFPGFGFMYDAMDDYIKYTEEQEETVNIAIAILASTLQYIIKKDWSGIEFSYTVKGKDNSFISQEAT
jgi:hypothetical protein